MTTPEFSAGGTEAPDSLQFDRVVAVARNQAGQVVVGDVSNGQILLFSPDGSLVRRFGRRGQGPGDFDFISRIHFLGPDTIAVADPRRALQMFDASGRLLGNAFGPGRPGERLTSWDGFGMEAGSPGSRVYSSVRRDPEFTSTLPASSESLPMGGVIRCSASRS